MGHSLTTTPATATLISTKSMNTTRHAPSIGFQRVWASHGDSKPISDTKLVHRRTVTFGLAGAMLGLNISGDQRAVAARKPPPPAPQEKTDPNVSGVQAKVIASKKRKEAMKEAMSKLREKGKPIKEPSEGKATKEPSEEKPTNEPSE